MNRFNFIKDRKFRQGGVSAMLTAVIIAAVIVLNLVFGLLADKFYWNFDLSGGYFFTLTDYAKKLLNATFEEMPENRKTQNLRYEEENRKIIEEVNALVDSVNSANGNTALSHLDASTYSKDTVMALNSEIAKANETHGTEIEEFLYRSLISQVDEHAKIKIIFCNEEDDINADSTAKYVLETAKQLRTAYPDYIELEFVNIYANPSAVSKYKTSSLTNIYSSDVIIESGNEYRVVNMTAFFAVSSDDTTTAWAYNGEKKFISSIMAITQAEAPIVGVLLNHGETFYDYELLTLLEDAGYVIQELDLTKDEIPEECRLILCYNPDKDFLSSADVGEGERSEISALSEFLSDYYNSFMVFMSPDTPKLKNLEEFLEMWGITFDRTENEDGDVFSNVIKETLDHSVTSDGYGNIAQYVTEGGAEHLTSDMRQVLSPAKVIFRNAMSISYPDTYTLDRGDDDTVGTDDDRIAYFKDGVQRYIYNVFTSSSGAIAMSSGKEVGKATEADPFVYMTMTEEYRGYAEPVYDADGNDLGTYEYGKASSYVVAFSSVEFATEQYLMSSSYGNSEVLLRTLRELGKESVPISLPLKPFEDTTIENIDAQAANIWTAVLAILPAISAAVVGLVVIIRRKNR